MISIVMNYIAKIVILSLIQQGLIVLKIKANLLKAILVLLAICIRTSTERPEALDKACFILAGIDEKSLLQAVDVAVEMNGNSDIGIPVPDYIEENVSTKVVKLIQSYTGVVNKMVWRKY